MKKTAFILTACLLAGLCTACGGAQSTPDSESVPAGTTAAAPAETTSPAETEAAAPEPTSDKLTFRVGDYHAKAGDKHVPVTLEVENSPGFAMLGLRMHYDEALSPCMEGDDKLKIEGEDGPLCSSMMMTHAANTKDHVLGFAGFAVGGTTPEGSGKLVTCYFDIPADAKPGTKYELRPEPVNVQGTDKKEMAAEVVIGYITIDE